MVHPPKEDEGRAALVVATAVSQRHAAACVEAVRWQVLAQRAQLGWPPQKWHGGSSAGVRELHGLPKAMGRLLGGYGFESTQNSHTSCWGAMALKATKLASQLLGGHKWGGG